MPPSSVGWISFMLALTCLIGGRSKAEEVNDPFNNNEGTHVSSTPDLRPKTIAEIQAAFGVSPHLASWGTTNENILSEIRVFHLSPAGDSLLFRLGISKESAWISRIELERIGPGIVGPVASERCILLDSTKEFDEILQHWKDSNEIWLPLTTLEQSYLDSFTDETIWVFEYISIAERKSTRLRNLKALTDIGASGVRDFSSVVVFLEKALEYFPPIEGR